MKTSDRGPSYVEGKDNVVGVKKRSVTVHLSEFAFGLLTKKKAPTGAVPAPARLERAVRLYLSDRHSGRAGWAYPSFLHDGDPGNVELELVADRNLLRALEEQAGEQGASVSQMVTHAALYYVAELDAGHLTQRILDDLGEDEAELKKS